MAMARTRLGLAVTLSLTAAVLGLPAAWVWFSQSGWTDQSLARAREAYAQGDWEAARLAARERINTAPDDLDAWKLLARSAVRDGRQGAAQSIYEARIGMDRMDSEDFLLLGNNLAERRQTAAAIAILKRGLKANPKSPEILQELSRLAAQEESFGEATKLAGKVAEIPGWEARGSLMVGVLLAEQSDASGTADNLDRALKLDPKLKGAVTTPAKARKLFARALLKLGRTSEATTQLKTVLQEGADTEASWLLGRAYLQEGRLAEATAAQEASIGYGDDSVFAHEPAPFVGSVRCAPCHQAIYQTQQTSLHSKTFYPTDELDRIKLPEGPVADRFAPGVVHHLKQTGKQLEVETQVDKETFRAVVDYAIGSGDRGLTLVGHDSSRPREIRLSKYNDGSGWDLTIGQTPHPARHDHYLGLPLSRDELYGCVHCHTTDGRAALGRLQPLSTDHGIGCERCHGPGGNHLKAIEGKFVEPAIGRPRQFSADRLVKMCAQCHSPIGKVVLHPDDKTTVRFQAAHFVKSRCYTESNGRLSCITCHNPHRDAETSAAYYEAKCLSCHGGPSAAVGKQPNLGVTEGEEHSADGARLDAAEKRTPCPINATKDCLGCHMPVEKQAIPHTTFSDHYIRVHRETPQASSR